MNQKATGEAVRDQQPLPEFVITQMDEIIKGLNEIGNQAEDASRNPSADFQEVLRDIAAKAFELANSSCVFAEYNSQIEEDKILEALYEQGELLSQEDLA